MFPVWSHVSGMVDAYAKRRSRMLERVGRIEGWRALAPAGTFYLFINIPGWIGGRVENHPITDADSLVAVARQEAGVVLVSGSAFGAPNHIRLSFALSDETIEEGMDRIEHLQRRIIH
ncbi:MAG: aminotransferase class I/II-fold pyridoxal phosphate-dependent enzyme [Candidatus Latescibacterota bacterium]